MSDRNEFERHRNCAHCGRRLMHSQYDYAGATVFTKRCPLWKGIGNPHDFLEYRHAYPYRNRRGQVSEGTRSRAGATGEGERR